MKSYHPKLVNAMKHQQSDLHVKLMIYSVIDNFKYIVFINMFVHVLVH